MSAGVAASRDSYQVPIGVARRARIAGVQTFFEMKHPEADPERVNGLYERATMRRVFGLEQEPEDADVERRGWKAVAERLGRDKSLFKLWTIRPDFKALMSTADRLWSIEVSYVFGADAMPETENFLGPDETLDGRVVYAVDAVLEVGGKAAARIDVFEAKLRRPLPSGLTA